MILCGEKHISHIRKKYNVTPNEVHKRDAEQHDKRYVYPIVNYEKCNAHSVQLAQRNPLQKKLCAYVF
jgi:hypothetical protein